MSFKRVKMRDLIAVDASSDVSSHTTRQAAVQDAIRIKYCGSVVPQQGLVAACVHVSSIGAGHLYPSDSRTHYKVDFVLAVFCPDVGDLLVASPLTSFPDRVQLSIGFMQSIFILKSGLPRPSKFDAGLHHWVYDEEVEDGVMPLELAELGTYRVVEVRFNETTETRPLPAIVKARQRKRDVSVADAEAEQDLSAMRRAMIRQRDLDEEDAFSSRVTLKKLVSEYPEVMDKVAEGDAPNYDVQPSVPQQAIVQPGLSAVQQMGGREEQMDTTFGTAKAKMERALSESGDDESRWSEFERLMWLEHGMGKTILAMDEAKKNLLHEETMVVIVVADEPGLGPMRWWGE